MAMWLAHSDMIEVVEPKKTPKGTQISRDIMVSL